jgi:hypothetical protein
MRRRRIAVGTAMAAALAVPASLMLPAEAHDSHGVEVVAEGLDGPRGVDHLGKGRTLVAEADGTFSLVKERRRGDAKVVELGAVPSTGIAPAVAAGKRGDIWILTGAGEPGTVGHSTLYRWRHGWDEPKAVKDIAAYQAKDLDPYDLEELPEESNPYDVVALRDGSVLVADAAGNDLLRVWKNGRTKTVARLLPRTVPFPDGLPETDPEGNPLPPAGTPMPSEAVATSVTVGADGYWYVGELRGFPATPGTSQIWRIRPGSVDAKCNPERPDRGRCHLYADGLTSIVDLDGTRKGVLALSLSKMSWLQMELGVPGSEVGGLFLVRRNGHARELAKDQLVMPGGIDAGKRGIYVTSPIFGPGTLQRVH